MFDTTAPGGPGHLCLLVAGPEARELDALGPADRRALLLGRLARQLGPEVTDPLEWHEKAWHLDEHVGGGYLALPLPGAEDAIVPMLHKPAGALGRHRDGE